MTTVASLVPVAHKSGPQSRKRSGVERYQIFNRISKGTYGAVYRAWDKDKDELVAIKHEFHGFSRSTERELAVLKSLPRHRNIVNLREVVVDSSRRVLVIMEYFPFDLKRFMDADPNPCAVTTVKSFMRQLLQGVEFLHRNGVAHRDLKPTNVLVDREGKLKICDFGLSRRLERASGACTPGVVTLWYRAPEVLTGSRSYSSAIDMWSVGCIMGELVVKTVLFPGKSEFDQLGLIRQFTESPCPGNLLKWLTNTAPLLSKRGLDLLLRLLTWDPHRRITAKEALRHNWFRE